MDIKLIRNVNELEGTGYFEFLPRKYDNKHWSSDAVFLDEEYALLLGGLFSRHIDNYDHFSFMEATYKQALKIANDLEKYAYDLDSVDSFLEISEKYGVCDSIAKKVNEEWKNNKLAFKNMLNELSDWIKINIKEDGVLSILGV